MIVGVPREIKDNEHRVALSPSGARELGGKGVGVVVEAGAGLGSGISDDEYRAAGAEVVRSASDVFSRADIVVKVKEPLPSEYPYLRQGLIVFTFLHLAADETLTAALVEKGVTAVAYETVEEAGGLLPILKPMSEIAGKLSVLFGARFLLKPEGRMGVLLGGVPGVARGRVLILGAGAVGTNAAMMAIGMGAEVTLMDTDAEKLRRAEDLFDRRIRTLFSSAHDIEACLGGCDLLIGAVHRAGMRTPVLVTRGMLAAMKKGAVVVDVAVDQGGCVETIRPTTHSDPVYEEGGVIHCGIANMPGAVPATSTSALTNATLPYLVDMATLGLKAAVEKRPSLRRGINVHKGAITNRGVAEAFGMGFREPLL